MNIVIVIIVIFIQFDQVVIGRINVRRVQLMAVGGLEAKRGEKYGTIEWSSVPTSDFIYQCNKCLQINLERENVIRVEVFFR